MNKEGKPDFQYVIPFARLLAVEIYLRRMYTIALLGHWRGDGLIQSFLNVLWFQL